MQLFKWAIPESEMPEIRIESGNSILETATSLLLFLLKKKLFSCDTLGKALLSSCLGHYSGKFTL
jgi:hypothetical protein